ncbi:MAG: hypothetical protein ACI4M3_06025 [Acutalibacteraceae bacterium]
MVCRHFLRKKLFGVVMVLILMLFATIPQNYTVHAVNDVSEGNPIGVSDSSVDTSELTSEDWSQIQEEISSAMNSDVEISVNTSKSPFENIKSNDGTNGNDSVWFLVLGIGLVSIGALILAFVIFLNVLAHRKGNSAVSNKK